MSNLGIRFAAGAIAAGLALAGPGMTGLALADSPDDGASAASTDPRAAATRPATSRASGPARESRAERRPRAASAAAANVRQARAQEIPAAAAEAIAPATTDAVSEPVEPTPLLLIDLPATAAAGNDSGVTDEAPTPVAQPQLDSAAIPEPGAPLSAPALIITAEPLTTLRSVRAPSAAPAPITIQTALSAVAQQIDQVLNGLINWLSALPASPLTPVTDFLAGALQLVRRSLTPVLGGVDGTYVYFTNRTDQTLAVAQVPNGELEGPEAEPRYLAPGETSDFYGYNRVFFDVRLRIYTATQTDTGAWQKGELREVIGAVNQWDSRPTVVINLDPYYPGYSDTLCGSEDDRCNRILAAPFDRPWWDRAGGFKVGEAWFADYDLQGPFQSGQTGTYIERLSDRSDDYKVFAIEVFKIPTGAISDIGVPQYGGAVPAGRVNQK